MPSFFLTIVQLLDVFPGSQPTCITGIINWVHGTYALNSNGSITMTPMGDGYQQIQDPCAAVSNFIENYNDTELYQEWRIFIDATFGPKLHLFQFDGFPLAPQFQVSTTPNMLPTQLLRNVTSVSGSRSVISDRLTHYS
jgi:Chaperone for protein-folding within the ER, fungal